jgi:hypothetical protein
LILDRLCGGPLDRLDRGAVAVDQLIAALDEHLRHEHQKQRVPARGRQPRDLPRSAAAALGGEHPHPARRKHR